MQKNNESALLRNISLVPVIIFILFSLIIILIIINYHNEQVEKEALDIKKSYIDLNKKVIKKEAIKIHNIIQSQYNYHKKFNNFSSDEIKKYTLSLIKAIKYDHDGYIFIIDKEGDFLINLKKCILEENKYIFTDSNGSNVIDKIRHKAKNDEGYISYMGISGENNISSEKISYIKYFEQWDWAIGYGFHPNYIETEINNKIAQLHKTQQKHLLEMIIITVSITLVLIIILIFLSKKIKKIFRNYKITIEKTENENRQKNEIIYQQSKMTVIGELLNMISHQWRQPLSQINSIALHLYLEEKKGTLNEKIVKQTINDIENITQYLSQTIDDFSGFFIQESKEKEFLVDEAIQHCICIAKPSLHHVKVELNSSSKYYVKGYITLFQQIVLSLMTNALDSFTIRNIQEPIITINSYDTNAFIYIEVSDNAGGIDESYIEQIFDLYFSTKKKEVASGLGLYIAKSIIEKHFDANIFVENIKNGAKFTLKMNRYDFK